MKDYIQIRINKKTFKLCAYIITMILIVIATYFILDAIGDKYFFHDSYWKGFSKGYGTGRDDGFDWIIKSIQDYPCGQIMTLRLGNNSVGFRTFDCPQYDSTFFSKPAIVNWSFVT